MKLVIGTAQFGMKYGLFNKNKIKQFELKKNNSNRSPVQELKRQRNKTIKKHGQRKQN